MRIVATHPHDPTAFTEGYVFTDGGRLYESSGGDEESRVSQVDPMSGVAIISVPLGPNYFGEGLAAVGGELVQLTWKEGTAFRWSVDGLAPVGQFAYLGEGWGLTFDGAKHRFIQSDGTDTLAFRDPVTFSEVGRVKVRRAGVPVTAINELEWVDGVVGANVWRTNELLRIDPTTGRVTGVVDASPLVVPPADPEDVLNGIAHRPGDPANRLWVTGKRWSTVTEIVVT